MDYRLPVYQQQPSSVMTAMRKALGWVGGKNDSQNPGPDAFSPIAAMTMPTLLDPVTARLADLLGSQVSVTAGGAGSHNVDGALVPDDEVWWIHSCGAFFVNIDLAAAQAYLILLPGVGSKFSTLNWANGVRLADNPALHNNAVMCPPRLPFLVPPGGFIRFQWVATAAGGGDGGTLQFLYLRLKLGERHP